MWPTQKHLCEFKSAGFKSIRHINPLKILEMDGPGSYYEIEKKSASTLSISMLTTNQLDRRQLDISMYQ